MARRDAYGKCPVKWFIDDLGIKRWVCFQHLAPYHRHHENSEVCWYSTCPGRSKIGYPLTKEEIEARKSEMARQKIKENEKTIQIEEPKKKECDNYGCKNQVALGRKRYCSDKCRLQKARADYETRNPNRKTRKKLKKKKDTPATPPKPVPPETKNSDVCTSITCSNKVPPTRKAYCSDPCRKRAYVQRKKGLLKT